MRALRDAKAFAILILAVCAIICSYTLPVPAGSSGAVQGGVAETRAINTTSPVAGGGDLSANRTITFSNTYVDPSINGFRVSLTSLTPVTTANVASGTALYLCTYTSDRMAIWDGSEWDVLTVSGEPVVYLTGLTADTNYDVFAQASAGSVTIDATLVAWTNDTTRATALDEQDGVRTKGGDRTRRYVATIRASGATTTDDKADARHLFNACNRVARQLRRAETTDTWVYTLAAYQIANASDANRVTFLRGLNEEPVSINIFAQAENTIASVAMRVAIGLDSKTSNNSGCFLFPMDGLAANDVGGCMAAYVGYPSTGFHYMAWLEFSGATGTTTWTGDGGGGTTNQSGIFGEVWQ